MKMPRESESEKALQAAHKAIPGGIYREHFVGQYVRIPMSSGAQRLEDLARLYQKRPVEGGRHLISALQFHLSQNAQAAKYKYKITKEGNGETEHLLITHSNK